MTYQATVSSKENLKLKASIYNPEPMMRGIGVRTLSFILRRVNAGVGPANASLTKDVKKGDQTLRDNGQLLGSIHERHTSTSAEVASSHIAAIVNNPDDPTVTSITIEPKRAKYLTLPAGPQTRTLQRRFGFTPKALIDGLRGAGYSVFRPFKRGSNTVRANVIMAKKKGARPTLKSGRKSQASQWQAFVLFILSKSVKMPLRRFMYLDELELAEIDQFVEAYYGG